ncbi:MAG: hypothetical protein GF320_16310 [Armatimonadia bacterium]|nr:hypothetical protein [Armatimonadia bacterium]
MRCPAILFVLVLLLGAAAAHGQLLGYENGGDGAGEAREAQETISEVYECLAIDCRSLAARLGGGAITDPMADMARDRFGMRPGRGPGGWLIGGPAPYMPLSIVGAGGPGGAGGWAGSLEPFRPEGLHQALALVEQNAIMLRGTPDAIDETLEFLRLIDQPAPMVRIELQAISTPEVFDRGNALQWIGFGSNAQITGRAGSLGSGNNLSLAFGDIALAYDAFVSRSRGYEDQTVSIMTESGLPAYMGVRNVEPNFIPIRSYDRFGNIVTTYDVIYSTTETSLLVLPRVNADDSVTMLLSPRFSRQVGTTGPPGGTGFPIIESLDAGTMVRVGNGQTIAIGGLRRVRVDRQWQGGAVAAGMIPEIRQTVTVENVNLFVTPHVYRPEDDSIEDIRM